MTDSITCPVCGRTSWHPVDVTEGWCGACHGATALPPPPGFRWVLFATADPLDRFGRLLEQRWLEDGSTYDIGVGEGAGTYVFRDDHFVPA